MKKILLTAVAALAIVGCTQNEEIEKAGEKAEIGFTTLVSKTTRVTPMVTDNFEKFTVYAYNTGSDDMGLGIALSTTLMDGVGMKKESGTWGVEDNKKYYWPMSDKLQFFAYSPAGITLTAPDKGFPSFNYTVKAVNEQEDLLVAQSLNATKKNAPDEGIKLTFTHILTQINFSVQLDADVKYTINSIQISGVNDASAYTYATTDAKWGTTSGTASYEYAMKQNAVADNNVIDFSTGNNALMLLPQTLPIGAKIVVNYSAEAGGSTTFTGNKEVSIATKKWEMGKNIRYTLTLPSDAKDITFEPSVGGWVDQKETENASTTA